MNTYFSFILSALTDLVNASVLVDILGEVSMGSIIQFCCDFALCKALGFSTDFEGE